MLFESQNIAEFSRTRLNKILLGSATFFLGKHSRVHLFRSSTVETYRTLVESVETYRFSVETIETLSEHLNPGTSPKQE